MSKPGTAGREITDDERVLIDQQVTTELVGHLYEGCLAGTIIRSGIGSACGTEGFRPDRHTLGRAA